MAQSFRDVATQTNDFTLRRTSKISDYFYLFLILFAFKAWFGSTQVPVDLYSANAVPCNGLMPVCVLFGY